MLARMFFCRRKFYYGWSRSALLAMIGLTIGPVIGPVIGPSLNSGQIAYAGGWNGKNNPENVAQETNDTHGRYEYNFSKLPLSGRISKHAWACTFWPTRKKGVANRWHGSAGGNRLFSKSELLSMSADRIKNLSAVEKYDIARGDYSYGLTRDELARTANYASASDWAGLCHGFAPASLHYQEPDCVNAINKDGITIPFYSADVKGLLCLLDGVYSNNGTSFQTGTKNVGTNFLTNGNDINPGALHVILANRIGRFDMGVCGEIDAGLQVWNHPIEAYSTEILKRDYSPGIGATRGTKERLLVRTTITYIDDDDEKYATERALNDGSGTEEFRTKETYTYYLDLDAYGRIIGGDYKGNSPHPDFLWSKPKGEFVGRFKELGEIYNNSIK